MNLLMVSVSAAALSQRPVAPAPVTATGPVPATVILYSVVGASLQATLTWTAPTTKADGSALPGGDITHYLLRRYSTSGVLQEGPTNVGNVLTYVSSDPAGTWEYTVACVSAYGEGEESSRWPVTVS